jgi:threonine dehydrogenase-like Zn-dependent dehydrogenase
MLPKRALPGRDGCGIICSVKALLFDGTLSYTGEMARPDPAPGEALVRVRMAGICETDIQITKGYRGFRGIPGHEFAGIVEAVNSPDQCWVGKRVVGEINCGCGTCALCLKGLQKHCPGRTTLGIAGRNGAFAEYLTLPLMNLHEVPDSVSDEEAIFVEPLAAAFEIIEQVPVGPSDSVLVMGDGKLGILCALVLQLSHPDVTLLGKHSNKLQIAESLGLNVARIANGIGEMGRQFGVRSSEFGKAGEMEYARSPQSTPGPSTLVTRHSALTTAFDVVVDATGSAEGLEMALQFVRPLGTIVLKTTVAQAAPVNLAPVVINEITVVGSRCGPFPPALEALASGTIRVGPLLSGVFPLSRGVDAMVAAEEPPNLKIALDLRNPWYIPPQGV